MIKILSFMLTALAVLAPLSLIAQENATLQIRVDGVCEMCKTRIEKAAEATAGVQDADWSVETHLLTVTVEEARFNENTLHQQIAGVGHDTDQLRAADAVYEKLHNCCKYRDPAIRGAHAPEKEADNEIRFEVDGVCEMCKARIEKAAAATAGVISADWEVSTHQLTATVDPQAFDPYELHWNIAAVGHDTEKLQAPQSAYEQLHDCCKYRDAAVQAAHQPEAETPSPRLLKGVVIQQDEDGQRFPLPGVNLYWLGTSKGTSTSEDGAFQLEANVENSRLVVSFVGYPNDTLDLAGKEEVEIILSQGLTLDEVEVTHRQRSTQTSLLSPVKVQMMNEDELMKAACCTLSESFETNPAVDVSFTDAVTGTRQIEMLGLAGPYVQITRELLPDIRGLSALYGLTYIPGPWISSIQLVKGSGSVVNGFEGMAGQINVELRKPESSESLYLNAYGNEGGRFEANATTSHSLNERWHTALLLNGRYQRAKWDRNEDSFLDNPLLEAFTAVNRWKYTGPNGLNSQFGIKGTIIDQQSGQLDYDPQPATEQGAWGAPMETKRLEGWAKIGKVFPERPYSSLGWQFTGALHDQEARFGRRDYDAYQQSIFSNLIYQSIIGNADHQFKTGLSLQWDQFSETFDSSTYERNEIVPGAFFEYTFSSDERFTAVAGLRADHHNQYGFFLTPRLHLRYAPGAFTVLRASAGRGQRSASIFAENIGAMASAREWVIQQTEADTPYGLDAEVAWNFGLNWTQEIPIASRPLAVSIDAYHTRFENQIVIDYDLTPRELHLYNLDGASFSNSLQAQIDYELLPRWDIRLAYRFNDVQTDYQQGRLQKPLTARHRAFFNTGYETTNNWKFDATLNWQGPKRIPATAANPEAYQLPERSPDFLLLNTQISKSWNDSFELYAGVENLLNFVQNSPILASDDPFGPYFDSSLVWGPVFGRMSYAGLRVRIQ